MTAWKLLRKSENQIELDLMSKFLKENLDIDTVLINKQVSAYNLGFWELLVHESNFDSANQKLSETFE
ncbi:MAG: hypothetical protein RIR51_2003 [Bacteroidota bacterium]|jgi:hypothetical protein